ncbi:c-type cytochrome [Bacillus benzoevorans]|uniref:Mono/diheme cytochrome c family protein n=1 Tax=Bacillus benzoevorans TaxID=1456 RepID=A0A7X0HST4_9BACI|nr:cytochrome c [Bacillus benzoevorans]MBB6445070.1 mono/diheme cytochrome c family protein [Bacillus benzoevorans]
MKKLLYGLLCFAFLGFLSACGGGNDKAEQDTGTTENNQANDQAGDEGTADGQAADETTPAADTGEAESKFQQSCSACHGADLVSGTAPDLNAIGSKYSKEEILGIIENGGATMPAGLLKGADAEAVAAWLAEKK